LDVDGFDFAEFALWEPARVRLDGHARLPPHACVDPGAG
jgi:hypothetical protein